jgi:hypothetical protein
MVACYYIQAHAIILNAIDPAHASYASLSFV